MLKLLLDFSLFYFSDRNQLVSFSWSILGVGYLYNIIIGRWKQVDVLVMFYKKMLVKYTV